MVFIVACKSTYFTDVTIGKTAAVQPVNYTGALEIAINKFNEMETNEREVEGLITLQYI